MKKARVCILTGYGINADRELAEAFRLAGAAPDCVHVADLLDEPGRLDDYQLLGFPGGFSFGDHLGSGKVLAGLIRRRLGGPLGDFVQRGGLVIGICNGFQVLVKMGLLPGLDGSMRQEVSLVHNEGGAFIDRWVACRVNPANPSPWLAGIDRLELPVRHGEGRFISASPELARLIAERKLAALFYEDNPNGSEAGIAGITDGSGRVLGLMPHPEAFLYPENHPRWTREKVPASCGLAVFENGARFAADHL
jgi:phosphoribosylformylglycinamidine (FGAM) synthase-like amidotransferase family enzyme